MAVDTEISRQHLRQELALVNELAATYQWEVTPDYDRLLVAVKMRAHTGDPYIVEAKCDDYKAVPPFFEFIDPESGEGMSTWSVSAASRCASRRRTAGMSTA